MLQFYFNIKMVWVWLMYISQLQLPCAVWSNIPPGWDRFWHASYSRERTCEASTSFENSSVNLYIFFREEKKKDDFNVPP